MENKEKICIEFLGDHNLTCYDNKAVTKVSFLVRQGVWRLPRSPAGPGQSPGMGSMKLQLYLKLPGYFCYENDHTHVIKVVVVEVKITIQL
jgi:hypothetical protein